MGVAPAGEPGQSPSRIPQSQESGVALGAYQVEVVGSPVVHEAADGLTEGFRAQVVGRVGPQCGADHGPAGSQGSARPPDMECRDMPMPDRLLAPRMRRDPLDRQVNLDEASGVGTAHRLSPSSCLRNTSSLPARRSSMSDFSAWRTRSSNSPTLPIVGVLANCSSTRPNRNLR